MVFIREFPIPTERVRLQKDNVEAQVGARVLGKGTLYISEDAISWISGTTSEEGFRIFYPDMVLHAVSRDRDLCASDCIYVMLNGILDGAERDDMEEEEVDEEEQMTEIRFIPEDSANLQQFYDVISDCNLLHDPPQSNSSDEADQEMPRVPVDDEHMQDQESDEEERLAMFQRMNLHFGTSNGSSNGNGEPHDEAFDPGQFEDAD